MTFGYVREPLRYVFDAGEARGDEVSLLRDVVGANLTGHVTLWRVRVGADLPLFLHTSSDLARGAGLGQVALDAKGTILDRREHPVGLAFGVRAALPSATLDLPVHSGRAGWAAQAIVDRRFGPLLLAANVGLRSHPPVALENVTLGHQGFLRLGAGYGGEGGGVSLDLVAHGTWASSDPLTRPAEALLGGWVPLGEGPVLRGGVGMGLNQAIGAPRARAVLGISHRLGPRAAEVPVQPPVVEIAAPEPKVERVEVRVPERVLEGPVEEPAPSQVRITRSQIEIDERVYFDTNRATLRPESYALLDEVARVLMDRPDLASVRIEGHTDSRGAPDYNQDLSERRAAAVRTYLVDRGVEAHRLDSVGHGLTRPLDDREVPEAWDRNRRVEFVLLDQTPIATRGDGAP